MVLWLSAAGAKEREDLRGRVRDGVQRTDKDLGTCVDRAKLNPQQQQELDAAVKNLHEIRDGVENGKWTDDRPLLEHAVDHIDFLVKNAPIDDSNKQTLGIDLFTLRSILDAWKQQP
jgi:hypothetical protein